VDSRWPPLQKLDSPQRSILGKRSLTERLVSSCDYDEERMNAYLDLCQFVMRDAAPECNGLLLRGSSLYEENAIKLLNQYAFNFDLAIFHILNAEEMAIPAIKTRYLQLFEESPSVLNRVVEDQII